MEISEYRAFTTAQPNPASGNPAGVVLDAEELGDADMLRIAAELGFSETAFLTSIEPTPRGFATSRRARRSPSAGTRRSRRGSHLRAAEPAR